MQHFRQAIAVAALATLFAPATLTFERVGILSECSAPAVPAPP